MADRYAARKVVLQLEVIVRGSHWKPFIEALLSLPGTVRVKLVLCKEAALDITGKEFTPEEILKILTELQPL